jgi:predicted ATPase/transcriptional regulator with XRE-family HTH domain/tetratricopeptide (TPR) repeat protein
VQAEERVSGSPEFGTLLRQYRLAAGLSQEALAERARMSTNGIGALERGYRHTPQRETLALLATALALDDERRRLFEAAATRSAGPRRPSAAAIDGHSPGPVPALPMSLTNFVGREPEIDEIAALVGEYRLVTVTGSGGVGKTQTALRVACETTDSEGIRFVGLAAIADPALVTSAVASAVGAPELPNRSILQALAVYLKNKSLLLIFDNCEHVIDEVARIADALLASCPHVRILATSREPLRTAGERAYRLPSLNAVEGIVLFSDRAAAVNHHFRVDEENRPAIAELCRRLDCIPLAIELAAARVNLLSVEELTERLDERFRVLTGGTRNALPRQQTMRAAIEWSYDLLSPPERRLFERLSVFVGGCALAAAEAVASDDELAASDVLDLVSSLAEKSLVVVDRTKGDSRYRLLESTRAFAQEKLAQHGLQETLTRRHAFWIADLADRATSTGVVTRGEEWVQAFEDELENARTAIEWAIQTGDISLGTRIACGFTGIWRINHGYVEPRRWLEMLLARVDSTTDPGTAARILQTLSTVTFGMHSVEAAERALELDSCDGDPSRKALTVHQMSAGFLQAGRVDEAGAANERVLAMCREGGLTRSHPYAAALDLRAHIAALQGRLDEARECCAQALSLMTALGEDHEANVIRMQGSMGEFEYRAGHFERALECADAALAAARRIGWRHREATALANSAAYRLTLGDVDGARENAREALALAPWASPVVFAAAVQHLATVAALRGDVRRGARLRGYVDAWYRNEECERDATERRTADILTSALHEKLADDDLSALGAEGAQLSDEQALEEALAV